MEPMQVTMGRVVIYKTHGRNFPWHPQLVPATVVRVNVDGTVALALHWATGEQAEPLPEAGVGSVKQGNEPGQWNWPTSRPEDWKYWTASNAPV